MKRILTLALFFLGILFLSQSCQKAPFVTLNTPRSYTFTRDGGTQNITFTCNRDWSVSSSVSWIQVSPSSGSASDGEITVKITCAANTTYDPRSATITIKVEELSESVSISQDTGLGLLVSPKTLDLTNAAQTIEIEVQKNVSYSISIDDAGKDWITHIGTKGLTSEKATFSIAANETYDNREGKITFKQTDGSLSETVVVKQSQTNGLFITTPEYDLSNEAHTLSVEVKANIDYEVSSDVDWISNTKATTKGLVNSQITLQVNANETYDDREGHVTVKQKNGDLTGVITIRQDENYGILVSDENVEITSDAQSVEVEVKYNVDFDVIIPAEAQGTMVTSVEYDDGGGNTKALSTRKYRFGISENTDYDAREVSVTFKQKDGSLSGTVLIKQAQKDGIIIGKNKYEVGRDGETIEIKVQSNVEYDVVIPEDAQAWIKQVESMPTKGLVDSSIYLEIAENATYYNREAGVTINQKGGEISEVVTILQAQTDALFIIEEQKVFSMTSDGGSIDFNLFHNIEYEINNDAIPSWIELTESSIDSYNSKYTVIVKPSRDFDERKAQIDIKSQNGSFSDCIKITQAQRDTIIVDPNGFALDSELTTITISVKANVDYTVSIDEQAKSWIKESPNQGTNSYSYIIASNKVLNSLDREGAVYFKAETTSQTVNISQRKHELIKVINVSTAGTLESLIPEDEKLFVTSLTLSGQINGTDFRILQEMAGNDFNDHATNGLLSILDMRDVSIRAGGKSYRYDSGYYTKDNVFPNNVFGDCNSLKEVYLPKTITEIGGFAFYWCRNLTKVELPDYLNEIKDAVFSGAPIERLIIPNGVKKLYGNLIWNTNSLKELSLPETLEEISSYCISTSKLETLTLPKNVKYLGQSALVISGLKELHCNAINPPVCEGGSIGVNKDAKLYIPSGSYAKYVTTEPWASFTTIIEE